MVFIILFIILILPIYYKTDNTMEFITSWWL